MAWIDAKELDKAFLFKPKDKKDFQEYLESIDMDHIDMNEESWKDITAYLHRYSFLPWLQYKEILSKAFQDLLAIVREDSKNSKKNYSLVTDLLKEERIHDPYIYGLMPEWMKRTLLQHRGGGKGIPGTLTQKLIELDNRDKGNFRRNLLDGYNPGMETWVYGAMMRLDYTKSFEISDKILSDHDIDIITFAALDAVPFQPKQRHTTIPYKGKKIKTVSELISKLRLNYRITLHNTSINISNNIRYSTNYMLKYPEYSPMIDDLPKTYVVTMRKALNAFLISGYVDPEDSEIMTGYLVNSEAFIGLLYYGFPLDNSKVPRTAERRAFLNSLTPEQKGLLLAMYTRPEFGSGLDIGNSTQDELDRFLLNRPKVRARTEKIIKDFYGSGDEGEVLEQLEFMVPPGINPKEYFASSIIWSEEIFNRASDITLLPNIFNENRRKILHNLLKFTDEEIFNAFNIYIPYDSHWDLISKLVFIRNTPSIFLLTKNHRQCKNQKTIDFEDTEDPKIFIIAYGTLFKYTCFEPQDFVKAWGDLVFRIPGTKKIFPRHAIIDFKNILERLKVPFEKEILAIIEKAQTEQLSLNTSDIREDFSKLPVKTKKLLKEWLEKFYEVGWYMRRWKGPGHRLPYEEAETLCQDESFLVEVSPRLAELQEMLKDKELNGFVKKLTKINYAENNFVLEDERLSGLLESVLREQHAEGSGLCIRLASNRFIIGGYFYLMTLDLLNNSIAKDFKPERLVWIH